MQEIIVKGNLYIVKEKLCERLLEAGDTVLLLDHQDSFLCRGQRANLRSASRTNRLAPNGNARSLKS